MSESLFVDDIIIIEKSQNTTAMAAVRSYGAERWITHTLASFTP